jgi:hypothetical protein
MMTFRHAKDSVQHQAAMYSGGAIINLHPGAANIRAFVDSELAKIADGEGLAQRKLRAELVHLRSQVADRITRASSGNYLCARLKLSYLQNPKSRALEKQLKRLPTSLRDILEQTLLRIEQQADRKHAARGRNALLLAVYAHRNLTPQELYYALTTTKIEDSKSMHLNDDYDDICTAQDIVEPTGMIVTIEDSTVQVHKAVKDY